MDNLRYHSFYDERRKHTYSHADPLMLPIDHYAYDELNSFINRFDLLDKRCLEIGSAEGIFQDMVRDYYATDLSNDLAQYYHKPYCAAQQLKYPFDDEMFDAIWTITVYEHIPHLNEALLEIKRLLKPGGVVLFSPAWQCRSWAANGYAIRPYSDLYLKGKIIKALIPIRNNLLFRSLFIFPKRLLRHLFYLLGIRFRQIRYKKLEANYDKYWTSDSDACNNIDPHDAILWFESNGFECLSHPMHFRAFFVRTNGLIFRKRNL